MLEYDVVAKRIDAHGRSNSMSMVGQMLIRPPPTG